MLQVKGGKNALCIRACVSLTQLERLNERNVTVWRTRKTVPGKAVAESLIIRRILPTPSIRRTRSIRRCRRSTGPWGENP